MEAKNKKILIVDDEEDILEIIRYNLENVGFFIETAKDGLDAIRKAKDFKPDLILLDIMMPKMTGTDVLKVIKREESLKNTLIIFLTAVSNEQSEIEGLDLGADDYIIKPIKPKVLISRIWSALRRIDDEKEKIIEVGNLIINKEKHETTFNEKIITLTRKEFKLLELLASKPGKVFMRNEIMDYVWGDEIIVGERTIDVHIRRIRQKTTDDMITNVIGVGYKLEAT